MGHYPIIDAIRGLAALLVVLDHKGLPRSLPIPFDNQLLYAAKGLICAPAAVLVFFVLSCFCIHAPHIGQTLDVRQFLVRRFTRLGLPLAAATCMAYALGENWFDQPFGHAVIWSLACEALYYLIYPVLQPRLTTSRHWWRAMVAAFGVAAVVAWVGRDTLDYPKGGLWSATLLGLPVWLSGGWLAQVMHEQRWSVAPHRWTSKMLLWAMVMLGGGVASILQHKFAISLGLTLTLYGATVAPWLLTIVRWPMRSAWLQGLGMSSYTLYLVHQPLIPVLRQTLETRLIAWPLWIVDILTLALLGTLSHAFYRVIERPSHHLARRLAPSRAALKPDTETVLTVDTPAPLSKGQPPRVAAR
jgi:peptidoglycan/LPS O-acetylase OafA/YrhL